MACIVLEEYNRSKNLPNSHYKESSSMEITKTLIVHSRSEWRAWLAEHHAKKHEIWLIFDKTIPALTYLESVNEALCFGWIDGIAKRLNAERTAQRFTPRRAKSNWTELNKERARRLIQQGLMTDAGRAVLPDLRLEAFQIASDILEALQMDASTWMNFQAFPDMYQRIRIGYIEEVRKQPQVFQTRLANFLRQTSRNKMFGGME
jgi:uncharacterized protein YdeI (YjbR/CyaY-like superfamily)